MVLGTVPESTDFIGSSCMGGHFPRDGPFPTSIPGSPPSEVRVAKHTKGLGCGAVVRGQNWSGGLGNMVRVMETGLGYVGCIFRQKPVA